MVIVVLYGVITAFVTSAPLLAVMHATHVDINCCKCLCTSSRTRNKMKASMSQWFLLTLIMVVALNCATIVESNNDAIDAMLEGRATSKGSKATEAAFLLHEKKPMVARVIKKKGTGSNPTTSMCKTPSCPKAPDGCSFSQSGEKDENGCLKYPCGENLECESGKTYKAAIAKGKTLNDCVENKDSEQCQAICQMQPQSSFLELAAGTKRCVQSNDSKLLGMQTKNMKVQTYCKLYPRTNGCTTLMAANWQAN